MRVSFRVFRRCHPTGIITGLVAVRALQVATVARAVTTATGLAS